VAIPNWVGDVVLATPVLAALRSHFAGTQITYLMRPYVAEIVAGGGWHDAEMFWPRGGGASGLWRTWGLGRQLRRERFEVALLLTNSFRSGLVAWLAGARRRVGYARDGRSWLLTEGLRPLKERGRFVPSPVLPYYVRLAEALGCPVPDQRLRLGVTAEQEEAGRRLMEHYGLADGAPYALVNPGAAFGAAKCWPPERFAIVCERIAVEHGLRCVIIGAPNEVPLMRSIAEQARGAICCDEPGTTLGSLKVLARHAALVVCNDTGPRHYGIAFGVPTVTIFGPTHQAWTDTGYADEIKLQVPVECGPCQLRVCPLDLRCMTRLAPELVMNAVAELLTRRPPRGNVRV
jgi:heptosyltransferase-2